ncbi:MAG: type II toxin-antitoxin system VapC family toxin [Anaerolineae bacterium]
MIFLDTDVLIDCQRGLPAAAAWLRQNETTAFAIPGIVAMELVVGCRDKKDLRITQTFLKRFTVVWPDAPDMLAAHELLITYRLAYGVGIPDCLIAAMMIHRQGQLLTFNVKHYQVFPGLVVRKPYLRD